MPTAPPVVPMRPPDVVPDLTDVYADGDADVPAAAAAPMSDSRWHEEPTAVAPVVPGSLPPTERIAARPSQRAVLFGFVGGAALLLAVLLWPRSEHAAIPPADTHGPTAAASPSATRAAAEQQVIVAPAPAQPQPAAALDGPGRPSASGAAGGTPSPAPVKEPVKAPERRLLPEAQITAQPPAAGPATRSVTVERKPVVRSVPPPAPAPECTPQVDALGLCAPGAKVAERSGSR